MIEIKGTPEEIAALVVALQERRLGEELARSIEKAACGIDTAQDSKVEAKLGTLSGVCVRKSDSMDPQEITGEKPDIKIFSEDPIECAYASGRVR